MEIVHDRISEMSKIQADVTIRACIKGGGMRDFQHSERITAQGHDAALTAADWLHQLMPYIRRRVA